MIKKKIVYVLLMLFMAGFAEISCVEEVLKPGNIAPAGEGYFALSIDMGNLPVSSRAYGDEERGTVEELKIHDIRIVLYDGADDNPGTCKVEYVFDLDIHTPDTWTGTSGAAGWLEGTDLHDNPSLSGAKLKFITKPLIVADKPYKMLVLINGKGVQTTDPQSLYSITEKGSFLHEFNKAVKVMVDPATGAVKNGKGFFMSNHQGLVPVTKAQLTKTDSDAVVDPVSVYVARMVAKVMVKHGSGFKFPQGFDTNSAKWGLAVTNRRTYWMRKGLTGEGSHTSMLNLYADDPNYSILGLDMDDNFNNLLFQGNGSVKVSPSKVGNVMNECRYVPENTISAKTDAETMNYLDQATHVVVGYKYNPNGYNAGDSYYIFNKQIISVIDMNFYSSGGNIPQSLAGLKQVIESIKSTGLSKYPLDGTGTEYYETGGLRFCPQGQVYYYFPIRHFDGPEGSLGYYGVVRNNIYQITINSLKAPESDDDYLSAEVTIMPWNLREQSNTVGVSVEEVKWAPVKLYHYFGYGGENLYKLWTRNAYLYQTVMVRVNRTISGSSYSLAPQFKADLPAPYNDLFYTYCIPNELKVSENAGDNVMELIYTASYASAIWISHVPLCFIKTDGTVLNVEGKDKDENYFNDNPRSYWLQLVTKEVPAPSDDKNYVFIKHLPDNYEMTITDSSNNKYKITTDDLCARYYDTTGNPLISSGGILNGIYGPFMAEPVEIGAYNTIYGSRGIAVICERDN